MYVFKLQFYQSLCPGVELLDHMTALILWPPDERNWLVWKDPDARKLNWLNEGGEGNDRGWDGWMASPTWWTWVWVSSGSWWWTGKPGTLQSMRSQRVGHGWTTELNWWQLYFQFLILCRFWWVVFFWEVFPFHLNFQLIGKKSFVIFTYLLMSMGFIVIVPL